MCAWVVWCSKVEKSLALFVCVGLFVVFFSMCLFVCVCLNVFV